MSALYLCYAASQHEIEVRDDMRLRGIDVCCPLVLEGKPDPKRAGRKRVTQWVERVALPNYVWARMSPHHFHDIKNKPIKHLSPTMAAVSWAAERDLRRFEDMARQAYEKALRAKERGTEPPPPFDEGQALETIGGPLTGLVGRFRRIVEDAEGFHVEMDGPLGPVKLNPAHVRKAG